MNESHRPLLDAAGQELLEKVRVRLTRFVDRKQRKKAPKQKPDELETEWLISSRPASELSAEQIFTADPLDSLASFVAGVNSWGNFS